MCSIAQGRSIVVIICMGMLVSIVTKRDTAMECAAIEQGLRHSRGTQVRVAVKSDKAFGHTSELALTNCGQL